MGVLEREVVALVLGEENARKTRFGTIEYRFFDLFKRSIESCLVLNIEFDSHYIDQRIKQDSIIEDSRIKIYPLIIMEKQNISTLRVQYLQSSNFVPFGPFCYFL